RFNGGVFEDASVLPLDGTQLGILIKASQMQWKDVEPAIFGTLLERALDPEERHQLGAHYTPRAYVERLVLPTIVEPLRSEWDAVRTAALVHAKAGRMDEARDEIRGFHDQLCKVTVLDPACGSGNFLYVTLEHLKRLEGEVLDVATGFGENMLLDLATHTVDPHQFLGIELNPRAASLAELVLWIGYLQWHFRTRGNSLPAEPVLKKFRNIECRDAVLAWDGEPVPVLDESGNAISVWDRRSQKTDPVTGRNVPDETKRVPLLTYPNARPAEWPKADYIVGNPPFLGPARMREDLGDGYAETLRKAYPEVPESADFVMYWWHKAAALVGSGQSKRFGLITTNSLRQTFNRRIVEAHLSGSAGSAGVPPASKHPSGQDARARGQDPRVPFFDPLAEVTISTHKLPHWNQADCFCFVTWRLDDALPQDVLDEWEKDREIWLKEHPKPWDSKTERHFHELFSGRLDEWLDAGHGSCALKHPDIRKIVADALAHFDGQRYDISSYVIMPNHVHVLLRLRPDLPLSDILHSWKSFTAKAINKALNRKGSLWQHEYWDRLIRSERHFADCLDYIKNNPNKARLPEGSFTLSTPGSAGVPPASKKPSGQDARAPVSILFAIPDHPWVDTKEGAAVRIAMTVGAVSENPGQLLSVESEAYQMDGSAKVTFAITTGSISADLTTGADVAGAVILKASEGMSCEGIKLHGMGFVVTVAEASLLGLGSVPGVEECIRPYLNGRDLADNSRGVMVIDLYGLSAEQARMRFPAVYQHVLTKVKPERDANNRATYRDNWWIFGEPRRELRPALNGLHRYIATIKTAKHRVFQFLDASVIPDSKLIVFPIDDAHVLGVLSSHIHLIWASGTQALLEDRPTYVKSASFDKFPFPTCDESSKARIRALSEELDAHRKRVQAAHPGLTLTGMYNVLEALREGRELTPKEQAIHDNGLVSVLRQLHDELDAAVADAYGWSGSVGVLPPASTKSSGQDARAPGDAEILRRLVALNAERAAEEAVGKIRWLRPEYQNPTGTTTQGGFSIPDDQQRAPRRGTNPGRDGSPSRPTSSKLAWPKSLSERVRAIEEALANAPATPTDLAKRFSRAKESDIAEILETLATLGRVTKNGEHFNK
ncbi:MAG: DNA methyltransferase, partial [Verrucomicrobiota bacterium]